MNKTNKPVALITLVMLILTLSTTVPAADIQRSAQYVASLEARQAVMEKYGFTNETLGCFVQSVSTMDDTYLVEYSPIRFTDKLGTYAVEIKEGEAPVVTWSYGRRDPELWASGELDDAVWGSVQAAKYLDLDFAYQKLISEIVAESDGYPWTMENAAKWDKLLIEAKLPGSYGVLPTENDLSPEEVIALSREAVMQKYGVTEELLAQYEPIVGFFTQEPDAEGRYSVTLMPKGGELTADFGSFMLTLRSPSGTVEECYWSAGAQYRTLPDGPLDNYADAIKEFVEQGALYVMPHAEKAELAGRIEATGYKLVNHFIAPKDTDIPEAEAIAIAKEALLGKYGLTDEILTLFIIDPSLQTVHGVPSWVISFGKDWQSPYSLIEKLGVYNVSIASDTGEVIQANWTLDHLPQDTKGYTQSNWGQAPALDASLLPWAVSFDEEDKRLVKECEETDWSLESVGKRDQLYRDAGFGWGQYPFGLPGAGDLTREQAFAIAKEALVQDIGMDENIVNTDNFQANFWVADPEQHSQWVFFNYINNSGCCLIVIDSRTGEVLEVDYRSIGNG